MECEIDVCVRIFRVFRIFRNEHSRIGARGWRSVGARAPPPESIRIRCATPSPPHPPPPSPTPPSTTSPHPTQPHDTPQSTGGVPFGKLAKNVTAGAGVGAFPPFRASNFRPASLPPGILVDFAGKIEHPL